MSNVALTGGLTDWTVVSSEDFITFGAKTLTTQAILYAANPDLARSAQVTFTATGSRALIMWCEVVDFGQLAAPPSIRLETTSSFTTIPASPTGGTGTITVTIILEGGADSWSATKSDDDDDAFISDFTSGGDRTSNTLTITYNANTGLERSATLTIQARGSSGSRLFPIDLTQLGAAPTLTYETTPSDLTGLTGAGLTAAGSTFTIDVSTDGSATGWTAAITSAGDFITLDKTTRGGASPNIITVSYAVNATTAPRDGEITLRTEGGSPAAMQVVSFTQEAAQGLSVVTDPADLTSLSRESGTIDVDVTLLGSATGWRFAGADDPLDFLTLNRANGVGGEDVLTIRYDANMGDVLREGAITLGPTGGTGLANEVVISISQLGTGQNVVISAPVGSDFLAIPALGGTFVAEVALEGDADGWTAVASSGNPEDFITVNTPDVTNETQTFVFAANAGLAREGQVTFTTTGGVGPFVSRTFDFRQLGGTPTIDVTTPPEALLNMIPAEPTGGGATGTITATIDLGGGATGWTATKGGDDSNAFIASFTPMGNRTNNTLTITYNENVGLERSVTLTISTVGGTGVVEAPLELTQLGAAPTISLSTAAVDYAMISSIPLGGGSSATITQTVTLGGGAEGWAVRKDGDDGDTFITNFTEEGNRTSNTLTITYSRNTGVERTATLTISTEGGTGVAEEVLELTQLAAPPTLTVGRVTEDGGFTVPPTGMTYAVLSLAQRLTVPITLAGAAERVSYTTSGGTFLTSVTPLSPPFGYVIVFGENTGVERDVTLTFEALDGDGNSFSTAVTQQITITQLAAAPTLTFSTSPIDLTDELTAAGSTFTINVATGGGASGWTAAITNGAGFVEIDKAIPEGASPNVITVTYEANTTTSSRDGAITLMSEGGTGSAVREVVEFTQEGAQGISVSTDPADITTLTATAGTINVGVGFLGSAEGWTAVESDSEGFLELSATAGSGDLVITYAGNTTASSRMGTVTLTATGGTGTAESEVLTITQLAGADHTITLALEPSPLTDLFANGSTFRIVVSALGGGAESWTSVISEGAGFTTSNNLAGDAETDNVARVTVDPNNTAFERTVTFTYTTVGTGGFPATETISLTQLVGTEHTLTPTPTFTPVLVEGATLLVGGGEISIALALGGGATDWTATENLDYVRLVSPSGRAADPVEVLYESNPTFNTREVAVSITTAGLTGAPITRDITFTQAGIPPTLTFSSSDLAGDLPASRNTSAIEIAVFTSGTATGFTAQVTQGGDFATRVTGEMSSPVIISLAENTAANSRSGILTLTEVGGIPPYTIEIPFTQSGTAPALRVTTRPDLGAPLSSSAGSINVDVALLGGATGWSATEAATNPAGFLNLGGTTSGVAGSNVLTITYGQNTGGAREGVVTLSPSGGGDPVLLTITQLGLAPSLVVSAPSGSDFAALPALGGTIVANVALTGGLTDWTVAASEGFITVNTPDISGKTQTLDFATNAGLSRDGQVTFTATGVGVDAVVQTVDFSQLAATPTITVAGSSGSFAMIPADPGASTGTITATITLGGGAETWSATKSADLTPLFITDFTSEGDRTSNTLTVTYNANTGSERSAVLTVVASGSSGSRIARINLRQLGAAPTLTFGTTPSDLRGLTAGGSTFTIDVSTGGTATGWTATITSAGDFITLDKTTRGGVSPNVITVTYAANVTTSVRDGEITLTTEGGSPAFVERVGFTQVGAQGLSVVTDPTDVTSLSRESGTIDVDVALLGSATGWSVRADDPESFLNLSGTNGVAGDDVLTIRYEENTGDVLREGSVTFTPTGGTGLANEAVISISQLGTGQNVVISAPVGSDFLAIPAAGGLIVADVALAGDAGGWTAVASSGNPEDFITVNTPDISGKTQTLDFATNAGLSRDGQVTFTTTGGVGPSVSRTFDFRQLGGAPTISVTTPPEVLLNMIPADPTGGGATGTITATIDLGGGATGWTATKDGDDSNAFIASFTPVGGGRSDRVLTITYNENAGVERSATLTIRTLGGTGDVEEVLELTQLGAAPTISLSSPLVDYAMLSSEPLGVGSSTTVTQTVTLGGGAEGWTVRKDGDEDDAFILNFVSSGDRANSQFRITYSRNTGLERSVTLTISTEGGTGVAEEVLELTQLAAPPILTFSTTPNALTGLTAEGSTFTIDVSVDGGATSWTAAITNGAGFVSIDKGSPRGVAPDVNTITVTYVANATTTTRDGAITLTSEGGTGTAATQVVSFMQEGSQGISVVTDPLGLTDLDALGGNILVNVSLSGSATGWRASEDSSNPLEFLTFNSFSGGSGPGLRIGYLPNTTALSRMGTVTLTATGGTGTAQAVLLTIMQAAGAPHTFTTTSTYNPLLIDGSLTAAGGTITTTFALEGAEGWEAEESLGYASLSSDEGEESEALVVTYDPNPTFVERYVDVSITTTGPSGVSITRDITFTQEGAQGITVTPPSNVESLMVGAGTISGNVALFGSATGWDAAITTDPSGFLTLRGTSGVGGTGVLRIDYTDNKTTSSRTGTVTLTATGGTGRAQEVVFTITQVAGADHTITLTPLVIPDVAGDGGEFTITVSALGGGAESWTSEITSGDGFSRTDNADGDATDNVATITVDANTTSSERVGSIRYETDGATGVPTSSTISFTQARGADHTFSEAYTYSPALIDGNLTAARGTISIALTPENGATGWTASSSHGYVELVPDNGNASTPLVVRYAPNPTSVERPVVVSITTIGSRGVSITRPLTFNQEGAQGLSVVTDPTDVTSLSRESGTISGNVALLGSAEGWDAAITSDPSDFLTLNTLRGVGGTGVLSIDYTGNKTTSSRTGEVTLTATGGRGTAQEVVLTITQVAGADHTITLTPLTIPDVAGDGGTFTITVSALGGGADTWTSEIISGDGFSHTDNADGDAGADNVATITVDANTTSSERGGSIRYETDGATGVPTSSTISFTQAKGEEHTFTPTYTYAPALEGVNLTAVGGTITTTFSLEGGADRWHAEEVLGYVSLSPDDGDASTSLVVTYEANPGFETRNVVVFITTTGPSGVSITRDITFTQEGAQGIDVTTTPTNVDRLTVEAGTISGEVVLFGSATGWDAAITNDITGFLTLNTLSGVGGTGVLSIDYTENETTSPRTGEVTLTATGGRGRAEECGA